MWAWSEAQGLDLVSGTLDRNTGKAETAPNTFSKCVLGTKLKHFQSDFVAFRMHSAPYLLQRKPNACSGPWKMHLGLVGGFETSIKAPGSVARGTSKAETALNAFPSLEPWKPKKHFR